MKKLILIAVMVLVSTQAFCGTKIYINTSDKQIDIAGEAFIPGEWKHVPDEFDVSKFPEIKKAEIVLQEKTQKALEENGLIEFAQGLKESNELYEQKIPDISVSILAVDAKSIEVGVKVVEEPIEPIEIIKK